MTVTLRAVNTVLYTLQKKIFYYTNQKMISVQFNPARCGSTELECVVDIYCMYGTNK